MRTSDRRDFLKKIGTAAAGAACASWPGSRRAGGAPGEKMNFVFILVDDLGWADVGCYGNRFNETPNIDRLAREGMRFTDAYAACPVCSPTRASIMAGQYPARVGVTDFITGHWRPYEKLRVPINRTQYLPLESVTLAETLGAAGYRTGFFGKWHLGERTHYPDKQGFDTSAVASGGRHFGNTLSPGGPIGKEEYLAEALTDRGLEFLEKNRERPFFLFLSHYAVHIPLEARKQLIEKYEKKPKPPEGINNPVYAAMVEHVDNSVGRVVKKIDELDLARRTVVIFFSDNGGLRQHFQKIGPIVTSNAPLRDEKGTLYEGGVREPLIVRWPGVVEPGAECSEPVTSVDFYPTLLDIAGAKRPADHKLDGESILPLLSATAPKLERKAIFWHYPHYHHSTPAGAIRQGRWKLIEFFEDGRLELYDLRADIGEKTDLAKANPKQAARLQKKLAAWRKSVGAEMPRPNPDHDPARAHEWGTHPSRKAVEKRPAPKK